MDVLCTRCVAELATLASSAQNDLISKVTLKIAISVDTGFVAPTSFQK